MVRRQKEKTMQLQKESIYLDLLLTKRQSKPTKQPTKKTSRLRTTIYFILCKRRG